MNMPLALVLLVTTATALAELRIPPAGLLADLAITRDAYTTLHPGLYRYNTPDEIDAGFEELAASFSEGLTLREAYLAFARFLATIRCGHTYANYWNQSDEVQELLFAGADKVPFNFRILDDRLVVTRSAVDDPRVQAGTLITAIDGVPTRDLLERLMAFVHADGSADHQRRFDLQVTGVGKFESFDIYQPLLYPPTGGSYRFSAVDTGNVEFSFSAKAMSRERRRSVLEERYGPQPSAPDDLWVFERLDDTTAYLKVGSFVTWKMELDWRGFLDGVFATLLDNSIENLILDIRGNGGGDNDVLAALFGHLLPEPITLPARRELVRYERVPEHLVEHLDTWDLSFFDLTGKVRPVGDGFYTAIGASTEQPVIAGSSTAFSGKLYLLVDPANSSATFTLAKTLKDSGRATLIGETTGGNRRGINGGQILFLRLPNSGLEVDLPLIGYYPLDEQPDRGVLVDISVTPSPEDIASGVDTVLEAARKLIIAGGA